MKSNTEIIAEYYAGYNRCLPDELFPYGIAIKEMCDDIMKSLE